MSEVIYNYESFPNIKEFLNPYQLQHLDTRSEYHEDRHTNPHWEGDHFIDEDGYLITKILYPDEIQNRETEFNYRLNRDGFRSNHFDKLNPNNVHVLYGGCSWTFGEGLPEELTWTHLLTEKVKTLHEGKTVEEHNTGYMGSSVYQIFRNIMTFIRTYGTPDYVFLLLPDMARAIRYSEEFERFQKVYVSKHHLEIRNNKAQMSYTKNYVHEDSILIAIDLMKALEDYCNAIGTKLLWSSWHYQELDLYARHPFNNFMDRSDRHFVQGRCKRFVTKDSLPYYPNPDNLPYWETARDDNHPGTCFTTHMANEFFTELTKDMK
jgi:hypothetical protein